MRNTARGPYILKNPNKYVGGGTPYYRSSWEAAVMKMCDENEAIEQWASEAVKIPYRDPLTGKQTVYVPDFLVVYVDKKQKKHSEIWEVKPMNQTMIENVGKNPYNQGQFVRNQVKWEMARQWARGRGITFRVLTEADIFHNGSKKR
jgi:hypothetical protein